MSRRSLLHVVALGLLTLAPVVVSGATPDDDWPSILGPDRDGRVSGWAAPAAWPDTGLPIRWRRPVGEGFAGPVVAGGRVVLFHRVGDEEVLQAVDLETGELRWRLDTMERFGVRKGFFGARRLAAGGRRPRAGERRWARRSRHGAGLLELGEDGLEPVWSSDTALSTHYATAVERAGTLFGFHGALHLGAPALRAVDAATGEVLWSLDRFGGGSALLVGEDLLVLRDNGQLLLATAHREGFEPRSGVQILEGEVRALPAVAGGTLYARGERDLVAVDLLLEPAGE